MSLDSCVHLRNYHLRTRCRPFQSPRSIPLCPLSLILPALHATMSDFYQFILPVFEININEVIRHVFLCLGSFTQRKAFGHTSIWLTYISSCSSFFLSKRHYMASMYQYLKLRSHRNNFGSGWREAHVVFLVG